MEESSDQTIQYGKIEFTSCYNDKTFIYENYVL